MLMEVLVHGLVAGGIYALISIGLSLIFGVMGIINAAHGAFYVLGAYMTYAIWTSFGVSPIPSFIISVVIIFLLGILMQRIIIEPIREDPEGIMILTLSLAILVENMILYIFGGRHKGLPYHFSGTISIGGAHLMGQRVFAFIVCVLLCVTLIIFVNRTKIGKAIRMVTYNKNTAAMLGINVATVSSLTFGIGAATVAVSGVLLSPITSIYPAMGWEPLLIAFCVVIFGGMGSLKGTLVAGILLGIIEGLVAFYIMPEYKTMARFLIMALILLFRPSGLFGKQVERA